MQNFAYFFFVFSISINDVMHTYIFLVYHKLFLNKKNKKFFLYVAWIFYFIFYFLVNIYRRTHTSFIDIKTSSLTLFLSYLTRHTPCRHHTSLDLASSTLLTTLVQKQAKFGPASKRILDLPPSIRNQPTTLWN